MENLTVNCGRGQICDEQTKVCVKGSKKAKKNEPEKPTESSPEAMPDTAPGHMSPEEPENLGMDDSDSAELDALSGKKPPASKPTGKKKVEKSDDEMDVFREMERMKKELRMMREDLKRIKLEKDETIDDLKEEIKGGMFFMRLAQLMISHILTNRDRGRKGKGQQQN